MPANYLGATIAVCQRHCNLSSAVEYTVQEGQNIIHVTKINCKLFGSSTALFNIFVIAARAECAHCVWGVYNFFKCFGISAWK